MKSNLGWFAAVLVLPAGAWAQNPPGAEMVEIEVRFVKATQAQLPGLLISETKVPMPEPRPISQVTPGILSINGIFTSDQTKEIFAQLKKSGAEIFTAPRTVALSGRKARVLNVREFRYPSKYSEPDKQTAKVVPLAFESRNVGISMEFEPKTAPDGVIELNFSTQIGELTGFADYSTAKETSPANTVWQPLFKSREGTTSVTLYSGNTIILSAPGETPEAKSNIIFVTAWELVEE